MEKWDAVIDSVTISVQFQSPDVLFRSGSAYLQPQFKAILDDFFPRYLKIIHSDKYINDIDEVRIEGHTSSVGRRGMDRDASYLYNMDLSQRRSLATLNYIYENQVPNKHKQWAIERITANGLAFSKMRYDSDGSENRELSRRVEFRVKTNAEGRIVKILSE